MMDWLEIKPSVALLRHIHEVWPTTVAFLPTENLITRLINEHPTVWGPLSSYGKALTSRRLGFLLAESYKIHSDREDRTGPRGYFRSVFVKPWTAMRIIEPEPTPDTDPLPQSGASGASGESGDDSVCGWCTRELIFDMEKQLQTCSRCQPIHGEYLPGDGEVAS